MRYSETLCSFPVDVLTRSAHVVPVTSKLSYVVTPEDMLLEELGPHHLSFPPGAEWCHVCPAKWEERCAHWGEACGIQVRTVCSG